MRGANLALRFLIELAALAGLAYGGANATSSTAASIALAVIAPVAAIAVWAVWSAPKAPRRLAGGHLIALELALLAVTCGLLTLADKPLYAAVLAVVAIANGFAVRRL